MKHFSDKAKAKLSDLAKQAESLPSEPFTLGKYLKGANARKTALSFLEYAKNAPSEGCFFYSCLHNIEQILKSVKSV